MPYEGVYYNVAVRRIRPYFGCRIRCCKKVSAVYGFCIAMRLPKIGNLNEWFTVFLLTLYNLLLDNHYYLSGLRIVVTVRSSQIADSDKLP